MLSRSNVKPAW